jgi:XS domain/XS zinc finger domain
MTNSSDIEEELSDISESEITDCVKKIYSQLQSKHYKVKKSGAYKCPFCPSKKKQRYHYVDILQHASGIGTSLKHRPKIKAQHQALAKYMKHDLVDSKLAHQVVAINPVPPHRKDEEKYVWPWKAILVNLPVKYKGDKYTGMTADEIKEMISQFNPSEVFPVWDCKGHTGKCIVDFSADWDGFRNAMSFDKHFHSSGVGRLSWKQWDNKSKEVHGWIAMEVDFNRSGLVADHLRQHGVLKSVDDVARDESTKTGFRVSHLAGQIDAMNQDIYEMQWKCNTSAMSLAQAMEDTGRLTQTYNEG